MRNIIYAIVLGVGVLALCLSLGLLIVDSQPKYSGQLKNAYYPFTVETAVHDL